MNKRLGRSPSRILMTMTSCWTETRLRKCRRSMTATATPMKRTMIPTFIAAQRRRDASPPRAIASSGEVKIKVTRKEKTRSTMWKMMMTMMSRNITMKLSPKLLQERRITRSKKTTLITCDAHKVRAVIHIYMILLVTKWPTKGRKGRDEIRSKRKPSTASMSNRKSICRLKWLHRSIRS